jgi:UDP-N-acetylmuramoylalanine--D-glutamate ligase
MSATFTGERAFVVGAGIAGVAAARALVAEGADVRVGEARTGRAGVEALRGEGIEVLEGPHEDMHLEGATLVLVSPGVPPGAPILEWARRRGIPVWGELELGARLARVPYLAVTGTNGKTTTTGMIASALGAAGMDAVACGNIGHPFPAAARETHDVLVVEASSFQLQTQSSFHPKVSVLLNLAPDHLDWHGSFEAYAAAKARVFARQEPGDVHVGNRDDAEAARVSSAATCDVRWFSLETASPDAGGASWHDDALLAGWSGAELLRRSSAETPAMRADAAAAAVAAHAFGAPDDAIRTGLASYVPERHRGETVAVVGGVRFVDNSKATNPHATLAAVSGSTGVVLIAGGDAKGVDLEPLGALAGTLEAVVAMGASAPAVRAVFEGRVPVRDAGSIEDAARIAFELAPPEGTVLLAPACASWDMFRDYAERGDRFAAAARGLDRTSPGPDQERARTAGERA